MADALRTAASLKGQLLEAEGGMIVWMEMCACLRGLVNLLKDTPCFEDLAAFCKDICEPLYNQLGWDAKADEDPNRGLCRSSVIGLMSACAHVPALDEAVRRYDVARKTGESVPADLRLLVFKAAVGAKGEVVWNELLELLRSQPAPAPEVLRHALRALGSIKDEAFLRKTMDFAFSDEVRAQDATFPLAGVCMSGKMGRELAWRYFKDNVEAITARFADGNFVWASVVGLVASSFDTEEMAQEIEAFFQTPGATLGSATRRLSQALESVRIRAERVGRIEVATEAWLATQPKPAPPAKVVVIATVEEMKAMESPLVLDLRDTNEVDAGKGGPPAKIPGSINVAFNMDGVKQSKRTTTLEEFKQKLVDAGVGLEDVTKPIITHCGGGGRGQKGKDMLVKMGFTDVLNGGGPANIAKAL